MLRSVTEENLRRLPNHFQYVDNERSCLQFQLIPDTDTAHGYLDYRLEALHCDSDKVYGESETNNNLNDFFVRAAGTLRIFVEYQLSSSNTTTDVEKTLQGFQSQRYKSLSGLESVVALTDCAYVCFRHNRVSEATEFHEKAKRLYDENALAKISAWGEIAYSHRRLGPRHIHRAKLMFSHALDYIDDHVDDLTPRDAVELLKAIFQMEFCKMIHRRLHSSLLMECPEEFDVYSDVCDTNVKKAAAMIQNLLDRNVHPILTGRAWAHIIEITIRYKDAQIALERLNPTPFRLEEFEILPRKCLTIHASREWLYNEYRLSKDKKTLTILGRLLKYDNQIDRAIEIFERALEFGRESSCYHHLSIIYRNRAFDDFELHSQTDRLALSTECPPPLEVDCSDRIKYLTVPPINVKGNLRETSDKYRRIIRVPDDENMKRALHYIEQAHEIDVNAATFLKEKAHILSCLSQDLENDFDKIYDLLDKALKENRFRPNCDRGQVYELMALLCRDTTKRHNDFPTFYYKAVKNMGEIGMLPPVAFPDLSDLLYKAAEKSDNPSEALRFYKELVDLYDATGQMHEAVAGFLVLALVQTAVKSGEEKLILGRLVTTYVQMDDFERAGHCLNQLIENCDGLRNSDITAELYWKVRKNNGQFKLVIEEVYPDAAETPVLFVVSAKDSKQEIAQNVSDSIKQLGFKNLMNPQIDGLPGQPNIGQFGELIERSKVIVILFTEEMFVDNEIGLVIRECAAMKRRSQVITVFTPGIQEKSTELDHDAEDIFMICRHLSNAQVPRDAEKNDEFEERFVEAILERNRSLKYAISENASEAEAMRENTR
ncbi:uncharacterized protein LOC141913073 [Tubulanus polymorphus]|uniref:uncharacterized protein LOC141913073 n=1 Tax=Tubulanus polymorphus TaxID=672921 RepID=UPI003DA3C2B3